MVKKYHRTYFPHPGFVAEDVTFYRHGDTQIPPLATVKRMTVAGQWRCCSSIRTRCIRFGWRDCTCRFRRQGRRRGGWISITESSARQQSKLRIESILADGTTLDFLRHGGAPPSGSSSGCLADSRRGEESAAGIYGARGDAGAAGDGGGERVMGPFRTSSYGTTPMSGNVCAEGRRSEPLQGMAGHAAGSGTIRRDIFGRWG